MALAAKVKQLLDTNRVAHRVFQHARAADVGRAAQLLKLPAEHVLAVQVFGDELGKLLVVYPIEAQPDLDKINLILNRKLKLISQVKSNRLFSDCDAGCMPPLGRAYGLEMVIDNSIKYLNEIYFSSGSYTALVQISTTDFMLLNPRAKYISMIVPRPEVIALEDGNQRLDEVLAERKKLLSTLPFPELPSVAVKLLQLSMQGEHSIRELIELVSNDELLQKQITLYSQLPFVHGKMEQKPPCVDAIIEHVLGFDMVSHIALGVSAGRAFDNQAEHSTVEFWRHAFYAAAYAERITQLASDQLRLDPAISYLAGLFHNFGLLLISQLYAPEYSLLKKWLRIYPKQPIAVLEKRLLGMGRAFNIVRGGHAQLGESLLRHWQLPESICVITREHHSINYTGEYGLYIKIIQITNQLLREVGIGDGSSTGLNAKHLAELGLDEQQVRQGIKDLQADTSGLELLAHSLTNK